MPTVPNFLKEKRTWLIVVLLIAAALMLATFTARKSHAATICDVEILGGPGISDTAVSGGGTKLDLAQIGGVLSGGFGCDVIGKTGVFVGARARASWMHLSGNVLGSASLSSTYLYEVDAKLGVKLTQKTDVYGFAGWALEDLKLTGAPSMKQPQGFELGAGMDHKLLSGPLRFVAEYTWIDFASQKVFDGAAKVQPNAHLFRVGLKLPFGEDKSASIFDDLVAPLEPKGCDPKMGDCKHAPLK